LLSSLNIVTSVTRVNTAVIALTAEAKKKYQHQENAQPGGVSSEFIYTIHSEK
jgi:hypothetical protein